MQFPALARLVSFQQGRQVVCPGRGTAKTPTNCRIFTTYLLEAFQQRGVVAAQRTSWGYLDPESTTLRTLHVMSPARQQKCSTPRLTMRATPSSLKANWLFREAEQPPTESGAESPHSEGNERGNYGTGKFTPSSIPARNGPSHSATP
jgi:hypothetical protein